MSSFAKNTTVSAERTLNEVKSLLNKHGATKFAYFESENQVGIAFEMRERRIRLTIPLPDKNSPQFLRTSVTKNTRNKDKATELWERTIKQRFRALFNVIKFKLVAIDEGVATFEDNF